MVIERRDGMVDSLRKGMNPWRVLEGQRTWSSLKNHDPVIIRTYSYSDLSGSTVVVVEEVEPLSDAAIRFKATRISNTGVGVRVEILATGQLVNNPRKPWAGVIRYREIEL